MRIHRRRKRGSQAKKLLLPEYATNEKIRADELRVISETGEMLGVLTTIKAREIAKERGIDLVVVSPKAKPPVAKLVDYGQFKYQKEKEARKQKAASKQSETKGIRLSTRIGAHDIQVRMKRAMEFMGQGHKIKLEIVLRGREKAHTDRGRDVMEGFIEQLKTEHDLELNIEQPFKRQGARLTMIIGLK